MIDPLVVGGGKRIFRDDGALRRLRLVDSRVASTGAIIATYAVVELEGGKQMTTKTSKASDTKA